MTAPLVIFDLDGTLIDTAPDLIDSLNHTIEAVGLAPVTFEDLTHLVGQGVKVMIQRAFELRKAPLDETTAARLFDRYMAHYQAHMPGKSLPYPRVIDCLDQFEAAGMRLAVCTNKSSQLAVQLIEKLGLTHRFATMTCGDTFPYRKPDGRHILGTIERAGGDPATAIMIGDSINDILAAQNAGIPSVAVTFGYSDVAVDTLGPDHVIGGYDELTVELVETLISRETKRAALVR
ncbi:phosphoglycolate phosphatase [Rhizobium terrae]|uniref:phosphoglycolate phosphatase n=1 Tax=Rhizobium terrae TaxID=2171756 RepID=UPI000E3D4573|nr:phosphoglycolate phosphatase [Rhizobium terrae]